MVVGSTSQRSGEGNQMPQCYMMTAQLSKFPQMFHLETGAKEKMPYNFVNSKTYETELAEVEGCGIAENTPWKNKDYEEFKESISKADAWNGDLWNVKKYVRYYCAQDVRILREGFNKFRKMILEDFKLDVINIHSISSVAYQCLINQVFLEEENIYAYSGLVDTFIRKAIVGGRCMCRDNKAYHTTIPLVDFDSVSLYPSAISIMKVPLGKPKPFEGKMPDKVDYYICEIIIEKVNKHRHFPLIRITHEDGTNEWTDQGIEGKKFIVDKRTLDDWKEFSGVEFTIIRGIYWNEGTSDKLSEFIKSVFKRRLELKQEKNPLEQVYKLILNSIYGKMIQKPYNKQKVIIPKNKAAAFINRNYNFIAPNDYEIADSNLHVFEKYKGIKNIFSFSLIGVMVLSHSKHLMNRVMCLAEDLDIPIFYQDTDSMHIERAKLPILAAEFEKKYKAPLIGKQLCQFHSDFSSDKLDKFGEIYAKESIFLTKKIYLDILTADGTDETDLHIRLKGISQQAIKAISEREFDNDIKKLYLEMFNNADRKIKFNLTDGKPSFSITKEMEIYTRKEFIREINIPASIQRLEYN